MDKRRFERQRRVAREDYAVVLDFMPNGNPMDTHHPSHKNRPIAQGVGTKFFTLLEFHPKPGVILKQREKVYVGFRFKELRDKVEYVWGEPLTYGELTSVSKAALPEVLRLIVMENERVFIKFFNIAAPLTIKLHSLELLPSIGKKTMWTILEERRRKPFDSFEDLKERGKIPDPVGILADRILSEIKGEERYYLFVEPPPNVQHGVFLGYLHKIYELIEREGGV